MEGLQILYIVFAAIGFIFLGISFFGGDAEVDIDIGDADFDISNAEVDADSPHVFSIRTLAVFLLTFGVAGFVAHSNGYEVAGQLIAGFISSFGVAGLVFLIMKGMYSMQGSAQVDSKKLVGQKAIVTIPTTKSGVAQVKVSTAGGIKEYICREKNGKKLKQNDSVNILESAAGVLTVEK